MWMCIRIRLGRGRVLQEEVPAPIYHPSSSSETGGPDQGDLGENPGNLANNPDIIPFSGPDVAAVGEEMAIELPPLSTPPPIIFHNFSSPPPPTPMIPISSNNTATEMPDIVSRDGRNSVGVMFTKL